MKFTLTRVSALVMPGTHNKEAHVVLEIIGGIVVLALGKKLYNRQQERKQLLLQAAAEDAKKHSLDGIAAAVFIRQPNGSRTNLEYHVEQELIARGARVVLADTRIGSALLKDGVYADLNSEAHFSFIGSLIVANDLMMNEKEFTEDEYAYKVRRSKHQAALDDYYENGDWEDNQPKPVLKEREFRMIQVPAVLYQLSFRVLGRGGVVLASGSSEELCKAGLPSYDDMLRELAAEAVGHLDEMMVWSKVNI